MNEKKYEKVSYLANSRCHSQCHVKIPDWLSVRISGHKRKYGPLGRAYTPIRK